MTELLRRASIDPGDLIVLPELFDSGFSLHTKRTNDGRGATMRFLRELAIETACTVHGSRTVVPDATDGDGLAHNRATIVGPGGDLLIEYSKIHPFSYGREGERFSGGEAVVTYPLGDSVVCPAVCYDLRFPELFRRGLGLGAELFVMGANWPSARAGHWRTLCIARAIENQAIVLGVNRCGSDPHLSYSGGSIALDAKGEVLGEAGEGETVLTVELDLEALRAWRSEFPAWRDGRL